MFKLHLLLIDAFSKIKKVINQVIVKKNKIKKYPTKSLLFDIFSLANKLYQLKSTILKSFEPNKIYFLGNLALNLLLNKLKTLVAQIKAFNKSVKKETC